MLTTEQLAEIEKRAELSRRAGCNAVYSGEMIRGMYAEDVTTLLATVRELQEKLNESESRVHFCPKCNLYCKECECMQKEMEKLQERLRVLSEAAQFAWQHLDELREAWRTGAIRETDGKGGTRSNRNVEAEVKLRSALAGGSSEGGGK